MWRRRAGHRKSGQTGTAEAQGASPKEVAASLEVLRGETKELTDANRTMRDTGVERRLVKLRNLAGIRLLEDAAATAGAIRFIEPDAAELPPASQLPEISAADLSAGLIRAGVLRDGCLLVRGLIPREAATRFAEQIERSFAARDRHDAGEPHEDRYYAEFPPDPRFGEELARPWIKAGGGVLAVDAPEPNFEMMELFAGAGLPEIVSAYLGEPALTTAQKTTLRKAEPAVPGAWHQDGKFMGPVRALNLWLSLSRCGDVAPGLDLVPTRIDHHVTTQTDEAMLDYAISQRVAEEAAGDKPILRPIFEPGDALFFDELFLHKTGSDPDMSQPRYAIENWFFGGSGFPTEYAPIAV